jgi:allantoate deiminase
MDRLKRDLEQLGSFGKDSRGGVSRPTFSWEDLAARAFLVDLMRKADLQVFTDSAANIVGIRAGKVDSPLVSSGSHIDTGIMWGIFDGPLGVMGAIESVRMMNDENVKTRLPIAVVCFTDEEGTFLSLGGSKYFSGLVSKEELYATTSKYEKSDKFGDLVSRARIKDTVEHFTTPIQSHVELHIEQGPVLERERVDIGIVSGIVGIRWTSLKVKGQQAHAGATPMNMRRDPSIPAAKVILSVRDIALKHQDMVGTCGVIRVMPNVINAIPREVELGIDIRSLEQNDLDNAGTQLIENAKQIAQSERCELEYSLSEGVRPAIFSDRIMDAVRDSANSLGYSSRTMPSRAGHDSQSMTSRSDVGMIFVPSRGGISHAPEEWTDFDQAYRGVEVLKKTLVKLAGND